MEKARRFQVELHLVDMTGRVWRKVPDCCKSSATEEAYRA